jgi:outer membrane murein-binding lipoprotein Lpp
MKKSVMVVGAVVVAVLGFAVQASLQARSLKAKLEQAETKLRTFETRQAASARITREFDIAAGSVQRVSFSPKLAPGTLSGKWRSTGRVWRGKDDTISAFTLSDPNDAVIDSSLRDSSGSFVVKVSATGKHTFFFENAGKPSSTPRRIVLEAEFTPD